MTDSRNPRVSVIINCFNGEKFVKTAVESVFAQTFNDWEIIFWDNASTDKTGEITQSYGEKLRYFRSESTIPLGLARNEAIAQAHGDLIAFLDVDDLWKPEKLERQTALFDANPSVALAYSDCIYVYSDGSTSRAGKFYEFYRGDVFRKMLMDNCIVLSTAIAKRDVVLECGCFPPLQIVEEYALFLEIARKYEVDFVDEPLAEYLYHENNGSRKIELNLQEVSQVLSSWAKREGGKIAEICENSISRQYYFMARRALFHLRDKSMAKRYIAEAIRRNKNLTYYGFSIFCLFPLPIIQKIRQILLAFLYR